MIEYGTWKRGPARDLLRRTFGFDPSGQTSWTAFRKAFADHLQATGQDPQASIAKSFLSTTEMLVVAGALYNAGHESTADVIVAPGFFYRLGNASDGMLAAALAPVLEQCSRRLPYDWHRRLSGEEPSGGSQR